MSDNAYPEDDAIFDSTGTVKVCPSCVAEDHVNCLGSITQQCGCGCGPSAMANVTELGEITMELTEHGAEMLGRIEAGMFQLLPSGYERPSFEDIAKMAPVGTPERLWYEHKIANNTPGGERMDMDTYYELRFEDDTEAQEVRDVTSLEGAKAVAKTVRGVTGKPVTLVKVTPVDIDAPARTRSTSAD